MDKAIVDHCPNTEQAAIDFRYQVDCFKCELKDFIDTAAQLLLDVEKKSLNLLNESRITYDDNKDLHNCYSQGLHRVSLLAIDLKDREKKLNLSYYIYSDTLTEEDVENGSSTRSLSRKLKDTEKGVLFQSIVLSSKLMDLRDTTQNSIDNIKPVIELVDYLLNSKNNKIIPEKPIAELYKKVCISFEQIETGYNHVADRKNWVKDQYKYYSETLAKTHLKKKGES